MNNSLSLRQTTKFMIVTVVSILTLLAISIGNKAHAAADTCTWTGGGVDTSFTTTGNWSGCDNSNIPEDGDALIFDLSILSANQTVTNDLTSATFTSITISNSAPSFETYTIEGNGFSLSGDIDVSNGALYVQPDITVINTGVRIKEVSSTGSLDIGNNNTTLENSNFDGSLTGTGTLTLDVPSLGGGGAGGGCSFGAVAAIGPFKGDNSTFSGPIVLSGYASLWVIQLSTTVARHASSITVGSNASLHFFLDANTDMTFSRSITFNGGSINATQNNVNAECDTPPLKSVTLTGNIVATAAVEATPFGANIVLGESVTGAEHFTIPDGSSGEGSLTVNGEETLAKTKTTTISDDQSSGAKSVQKNNVLVVTKDGKTGDLFVSGGTLKGTGEVGQISLFEGSVAPGLSPGCLNSGDLLYTGGSLDIELAGATVCTEYDQQTVTGAVDLGSATSLNLSLLSDYSPAEGTEFVIISNDGADAVIGTFSGLAEGDAVSVNGQNFTISYVGGDGNDVVLTAGVPGAPDSGFFLFSSAQPALFALVGLVAVAALAMNNLRPATKKK